MSNKRFWGVSYKNLVQVTWYEHSWRPEKIQIVKKEKHKQIDRASQGQALRNSFQTQAWHESMQRFSYTLVKHGLARQEESVVHPM